MTRGRLYDYVVREFTRDARGHFTQHAATTEWRQHPRKRVEYEARALSRAFPNRLVTIVRDGVILAHLLGGRAVTPESLVADAAGASLTAT
jgi:capsule polysaccharide export protein KpsC/LpsZ